MIKTEAGDHPAKQQGDPQGQQKASVLSFDAATNSYTVKTGPTVDDGVVQVESSDVTPCVVFRGGKSRPFFLRPLLEDVNEANAAHDSDDY
jgi:hypothetical protein